MNREHMEAHLALLGWEPQTDYGYYHLVHEGSNRVVYLGKGDGSQWRVVESSAHLAAPRRPDTRWEAIPDEQLYRLCRRLQEAGHI